MRMVSRWRRKKSAFNVRPAYLVLVTINYSLHAQLLFIHSTKRRTKSEAEHLIRLWLRRLRSCQNCIDGVASRSGRTNQSECSIPGLLIGWFFRFCFRLWQSSFHWIISDGVVNGIRRNGNVLILATPIPSSVWLRLRLWFSIFTWS